MEQFSVLSDPETQCSNHLNRSVDLVCNLSLNPEAFLVESHKLIYMAKNCQDFWKIKNIVK